MLLIRLVFITMFVISSVCLAKVQMALPSWQVVSLGEQYSFRGSAIIGQSMWVTGSNNAVFVSQDGGQTWQNKSVNAVVKTDFRDITLFDRNTAIVMGVGPGEQSALYKTTDGGNSWQLLLQNTDEQGFFDSIAFWDRDNGLLMGDPVDGYFVIKKTDDGGKSWRRIQSTHIPALNKNEVAFAASGNTLIVGRDGKAWFTTGGYSASVYSSNDWGETWQRQAVPLYNKTKYSGGYGLALNHQQQLFVVGGDFEDRPGAYRNIARLTGENWSEVNAGKRGLRTAMSCQGNLCIQTGKTGNDFSANGGETWQPYYGSTKGQSETGFYTLDADNHLFLAAGSKGKVGIVKLAN